MKRRYGIQCAIVEAVEVELRRNPKFYNLIKVPFEKSTKLESLIVLDERTYPAFVDFPDAVSNAIATTGRRYHERLDYGEAYTHAAAVTLSYR